MAKTAVMTRCGNRIPQFGIPCFGRQNADFKPAVGIFNPSTSLVGSSGVSGRSAGVPLAQQVATPLAARGEDASADQQTLGMKQQRPQLLTGRAEGELVDVATKQRRCTLAGQRQAILRSLQTQPANRYGI
jgi:hypothetical protein